MTSAPTPRTGTGTGGIRLRNLTHRALTADSSEFLARLNELGLNQEVAVTQSIAVKGGFEKNFHLRAERLHAWTPGFDTMGLTANLQLDTAQDANDLVREIVLAMLVGPVAFAYPSHAELACSVRMRRNIVLAARQTALAFHTAEADRPEDCWTYDEDCGFTVRPGHALITALQKATQPGTSGKRHAFSCYRATEYVMLLAIAQELESTNPPLLAALQRQWERRAIRSEEFRAVFLREHGSLEAPLPPGYYVPGDRVWFRNPDAFSSNATGYEGSWVLYLGGGLFTNFWTPGPSYTLRTKCLEMFQWRHAAYTDEAGAVRIDESHVERRLAALTAEPFRAERMMRRMLRLRDPQGVYQSGGCLDASREYPRHVCPGSADLVLPPSPNRLV